MDDPELFGAFFEGETWDAWRVVLKGLFAIPLDDSERPLFRELTDRDRQPAKPCREATLICGRRGGKSRIMAVVATYLACFIDHSPFLSIGERPTVQIVCSDKKQARSVMGYIMGFLRESHVLFPLIVKPDLQHVYSVELTNRVIIEVHVAKYTAVRGYTVVAFIGDEIAFWPKESSASPDSEIIAAVRPSMLTIPHAMLLKASSPYGKNGVLFEDFRKHFGRDDSDVLVVKAGTLQMHPNVDPTEIERMRQDDPERASAEFDANFRADVAQFVDREVVDACVPRGVFEIAPVRAVIYEAFVDPSGGSADSMTLAIGHREKDGRPILDLIREARPPFSPEAIVKEFADTLKSYRISRVRGDRYAGEWPRERFSVHGISYDVADDPKSVIYQACLPLLNSGGCQLLDNPRLTTQLCALERRTARGGRDSIDHPPGVHDDVANAAAGVLVGLAGKGGPLVFSADVMKFLSRR